MEDIHMSIIMTKYLRPLSLINLRSRNFAYGLKNEAGVNKRYTWFYSNTYTYLVLYGNYIYHEYILQFRQCKYKLIIICAVYSVFELSVQTN